MAEKNIDEQIKELNARIFRSKQIIEGLEHNESFKLFIDDYKAQAQRLDDSWQWITDEKVLKDAQITKMATLSVINSIPNLKHDIEVAGQQLDKLEHPEEIIGGDFDNH
ncbi:MAG TPA: hypothetical protein PLE33_08700 [Candidatus Cloacimonas sp.]|nr:hypothetical protein [Candidatus Cloacimonas sp.]HPS61320.1 hypothetical protein [Candidatus Cloacimonas sp.]